MVKRISAPAKMDDRCRDALARGKVAISTPSGRFISEHDDQTAAMNADLMIETMQRTVHHGPLDENGQARMKEFLTKKGYYRK